MSGELLIINVQCMHGVMWLFHPLKGDIVTESAKTVLICTKYTYSFYHIYLFFCVGYTISVSFIGNFAHMMKFLIKYYVSKKSY